MAFKTIKAKHAGPLTLISFLCTFTVVLLYQLLPAQLILLGNLREAYRATEWHTTEALYEHGRSGVLPRNVIFLPIDDYSVNLDDLSEEEKDQSPALHLMKAGFPYPRAVYPLIIDRLMQAGASVVAFDIMFPSEKEGDEEFAAALEKYRGHVVIGSNLTSGETDYGHTPELIKPSASLIPNGDPADPRVGFVSFRPDLENGHVRHAYFRTSQLEYLGLPPEPGRPELWSLAARMAGQAGFGNLVPASHHPKLIRFVRELHPLSMHDIFIPRAWAHPPYNNGALFKDKIVFIGPYGNWIKDTLETPFGQMLGPQIHLSALSSILNRDYLTDTSPATDLLIISLAGLAAWLLSMLVHHPASRTLLLIGAAALYLLLAFVLFSTSGLILKLLSPNLAFLSSGFIGLAWERVAEILERQRIRSTMERYVSRDVVKEVLDNPQSYLNTLEGVSRRPITILFSDVRGFTTLTESADATELVTQLNEYLTEMVRIVFAHNGTLDKFMGDAVVASWGALYTKGEAADACRAVSAALDMLRALKKLNARWKEQGRFELKIGLGVNHGDAICGNIGSEEKREFTAIGDTVNLASRLEGATKEYHVDTLIGASTAELVRDSLTVRSVDLLQVKGKTKPVAVFTILELRDEGGVPPAWLAPYEKGILLYRKRQFADAERCFAEAAEAAPDDWLNQEYLRRSREYLETPPGEEWDGVHVMAKK